MTNIKEFVKERDSAFINFVRTDDTKQIKRYCKKYGVKIPKDRKVFAAGIYKAVQECTDIPDDVKALAMQKCMKIGFNPFMVLHDMREVTE